MYFLIIIPHLVAANAGILYPILTVNRLGIVPDISVRSTVADTMLLAEPLLADLAMSALGGTQRVVPLPGNDNTMLLKS